MSQDLYFNNISFEIEFLKNLKDKAFKSLSSFIKRIEKHDMILDLSRVIAVILINNGKKIYLLFFKIYI